MKTPYYKLRLLLMLPLLLIIFNCQKDDAVDFSKSPTQEVVTQKVMTLDEVRNLPQMKGRFSNVRTKDNDSTNIFYSEKYKFSINVDRVMLVQKGNYHSLSFPVIRTQPSRKLENLFLHPYNGGYLPYLLRYNFDEKDWLDFAAGITVTDLISKMEIVLLEDFDIEDLGLNIKSFGETVVYDAGDAFWYDGQCWVFNHSWEENGITYTDYIVCGDCECTPPSGSSGGNSGGGSVGTSPVYFAIIDLGGGGGGGGSGSGSGGGGGGGGGAGTGSGTIWNPGPQEPQNPGSNPNNPGLGNPQNGNPVIGVIGGDIIYITNTIEQPCQAGVVDDVVKEQSPFTDMIKNVFNVNSKVNLRFKNDDLPESSNAWTDPIVISIDEGQRHIITITFNNSFLDDATDLMIGAVTLHEIVHAYLIELNYSGQLLSENQDYESLMNAFIAYYADSNQYTYHELDNEIHNAMKDFILKLADSLYSYAQSKNIPNVSKNYCEKLIWATMYDTELYEAMLTPQQQDEYNEIGYYETYNTGAKKGNKCP